MNLVAMFAIVGFAIFATQYLQSVLGMSPLTAALWSLVPMAGTMTAAPAAQLLAGRVDRAYIAAGGFGIAGLGFAGLTQLHPHSPIAFLLICAAIYAGGIVGVMTVGNELVMGAVPPERAGAAAAVVETATEFGAALGIAVLGSVGVAAYRSSLAVPAPAGTPPAALATARDTLGGAVTVAGQLPGRVGTGLLEAARTAFTHGLNNAALGPRSSWSWPPWPARCSSAGSRWNHRPPRPGNCQPGRTGNWPPGEAPPPAASDRPLAGHAGSRTRLRYCFRTSVPAGDEECVDEGGPAHRGFHLGRRAARAGPAAG